MFDNIENSSLYRVRTEQLLCPDGEVCHTVKDGVPLYYDDDHLANSSGAKLLAGAVAKQAQVSLQTTGSN